MGMLPCVRVRERADGGEFVGQVPVSIESSTQGAQMHFVVEDELHASPVLTLLSSEQVCEELRIVSLKELIQRAAGPRLHYRLLTLCPAAY